MVGLGHGGGVTPRELRAVNRQQNGAGGSRSTWAALGSVGLQGEFNGLVDAVDWLHDD